MQMQALEACGGDNFCLFDMAATGRMEVSISTFAASQELEKLLKFLDQVDELEEWKSGYPHSLHPKSSKKFVDQVNLTFKKLPFKF